MPNTKEHNAAAVRLAGGQARQRGFSTGKEWNHARGAKTKEGQGEGRQQAPPVFFEWSVGLLWLVLLWTWIKPIAVMSDWTEPAKMMALFAAVGICVVMDMFRIRGAVGVPLKGLSAFLAVGWLFRNNGGHTGIGLDWLKEFFSLIAQDARAIGAGDMGAVSAENRTLVFLAGWILLAGVIQSVLLYRKRALWLTAATWIYLILLQLWPGVDTTGELIAAGAAGTGLLGLLQLERIKAVYATGMLSKRLELAGVKPAEATAPGSTSHSTSASLSADPVPPAESWVNGGSRRNGFQPALPHVLYAGVLGLTLALFVVALAGTGNRERVPEPLTDDLWTMIERLFDHTDNSRAALAQSVFSAQYPGAVTGYGDDDTRLGGPLKVVDEPVFTARTPQSTYWRGESKSYYDGKGWQETGKPESAGKTAAGAGHTAETSLHPDNAGLPGPADYTGSQLPESVMTQEILYAGPDSLNMLFAGGAIRSVEALYTLEGKALPAEAAVSATGSDRYKVASSWGKLGYARLLVDAPVRDASKLAAASGSNAAIPAAVAEAGLQLPDKLPARIGELAADVTAQGATPYVKALLLEQYLKEHYRYSLTKLPVQRSGQDFVDAFLFGGGSGYCDYFSTAMTVMLRTTGIPARWVKGFAPGQIVAEEAGILTVEVSTKLAHSWVEAYIPGAGWVPFDPTPSFSGFAPGSGGQLAELLQAGSREQQAKGGFAWASPDWAGLKELARSGWQQLAQGAQAALQSRATLVAVLVAALILVPLVWLIRRRGMLILALLLLAQRPRGRRGQALVLRLLDRLWHRVFRQYGAKQPGQTFREYAAWATTHAPHAAAPLEELVLLYESARYAPDQPSWLPRRQFVRLWRQLFTEAQGNKPGGGGVAV